MNYLYYDDKEIQGLNKVIVVKSYIDIKLGKNFIEFKGDIDLEKEILVDLKSKKVIQKLRLSDKEQIKLLKTQIDIINKDKEFTESVLQELIIKQFDHKNMRLLI